MLLIAVTDPDELVGYTAVHPDDGEMFLLFLHPAYDGAQIDHSGAAVLVTGGL